MATRTIFVGVPLAHLSGKLGRGQFSTAINAIVDRYTMISRLTPLPFFDDGEIAILEDALADGVFNGLKIRGLHLAVLESKVGTLGMRQALADKIESLTTAQKVKLFDKITSQPFFEDDVDEVKPDKNGLYII